MEREHLEGDVGYQEPDVAKEPGPGDAPEREESQEKPACAPHADRPPTEQVPEPLIAYLGEAPEELRAEAERAEDDAGKEVATPAPVTEPSEVPSHDDLFEAGPAAVEPAPDEDTQDKQAGGQAPLVVPTALTGVDESCASCASLLNAVADAPKPPKKTRARKKTPRKRTDKARRKPAKKRARKPSAKRAAKKPRKSRA